MFCFANGHIQCQNPYVMSHVEVSLLYVICNKRKRKYSDGMTSCCFKQHMVSIKTYCFQFIFRWVIIEKGEKIHRGLRSFEVCIVIQLFNRSVSSLL